MLRRCRASVRERVADELCSSFYSPTLPKHSSRHAHDDTSISFPLSGMLPRPTSQSFLMRSSRAPHLFKFPLWFLSYPNSSYAVNSCACAKCCDGRLRRMYFLLFSPNTPT